MDNTAIALCLILAMLCASGAALLGAAAFWMDAAWEGAVLHAAAMYLRRGDE